MARIAGNGKRVTVKIDGRKVKGTIVAMTTEVQQIDITRGPGIHPDDPEPDPYRRVVPGRVTRVVTIVLDGQ